MATFELLTPFILQATSLRDNGEVLVSKHFLNDRLSNKDGKFSTQGANFIGSAKDVRVSGNRLCAGLLRRDTSWTEDTIELSTERVESPSGWTHNLILGGVSKPDFSPVKSSSKQHLKGFGDPLKAESRNLRLDGKACVLLDRPVEREKREEGDDLFVTQSINLDLQLGNNDGHFTIYGQNFSATARNSCLLENTLYAELRTSSGEWRYHYINLAWLSASWHLNIDRQSPIPSHLPPNCTSSTCPLYSPLPVQEASIRLCYIRPGFWDDALVCDMVTRPIKRVERYTALSYVWGSAENRSTIWVNTKQVAITINLFDALKRLRWHGVTEPIWIDALCINQEDTDEKNAQVPLMAEIYSKARLVVIWLGELLPPEDRMEYLGLDHEWLCCMLSAFFRALARNAHLADAASESFRTITSRLDANRGSGFFMQSLAEALNRWVYPSWYERAWTFQEFSLATEAVFLFRTDVLDASTVVNGLDNWNRHRETCCDADIGFEQYCAMDRSVEYGQYQEALRRFAQLTQTAYGFLQDSSYIGMTNEKSRMNELQEFVVCRDLIRLDSLRRRKATDARDKLFAFISIAPTIFGSAKADYSRTPTDIYKSFTLNTISFMNSFDIWSIINTAQWTSLSPALAELPSWAVDWSREGEYWGGRQFLLKYGRTVDGHNNPLFTQPSKHASWGPPVLNASGNVLTVRGWEFDSVRAISSEAWDYTGYGSRQTSLHAEWMQFAGVNNVKDASTKSKEWDKFWRTLKGDYVLRENTGKSASSYNSFRYWLHIRSNMNERRIRDLFDKAREHPDGFPDEEFRKLESTIVEIENHAGARKLFKTSDGRLGLCPACAKAGDRLFHIAGSRWPVMLRPQRNQERNSPPLYALVGVCYVQGITSKDVHKLLGKGYRVNLC